MWTDPPGSSTMLRGSELHGIALTALLSAACVLGDNSYSGGESETGTSGSPPPPGTTGTSGGGPGSGGPSSGGSTDAGTGSSSTSGGPGTGTTGGDVRPCSHDIPAIRGHDIYITEDDLIAGVEKTYDITGDALHSHEVTLTEAHFVSLVGGETISVTSTLGGTPPNEHEHTLEIMCDWTPPDGTTSGDGDGDGSTTTNGSASGGTTTGGGTTAGGGTTTGGTTSEGAGSTGGAPKCVEGQATMCTCTGSDEGVQICQANGTYGPCDCGN